jgi:uncharacterized repeat protein (TIGR03803 family)
MMKNQKDRSQLAYYATVLGILLFFAAAFSSAQQATTIYDFKGNGGVYPLQGMIWDSEGNLYGTTSFGGQFDLGTAYKLSPNEAGGWKETILHSFDFGSSPDGSIFSGLIFDAQGNLYGTTELGGANNCGTFYGLTPASGGKWTYRILYSFLDRVDGCEPLGNLIADSKGNFYGTTLLGGNYNVCIFGCGTVFALTRTPSGGWTDRILYEFGANATDGFGPQAGVVMDSEGNLYGTTYYGGGSSELGTVFELSRNGEGQTWTETILYNFSNSSTDANGANPSGSLIFDSAGNLYGTTRFGGSGNCNNFGVTGCGAVFELSPSAGTWTESVLHSFDPTTGSEEGQQPVADLIFDSVGNLYGTTQYGGNGKCSATAGCGTAFELSPAGAGTWNETVLYDFSDQGGYFPMGGLIFDASGNIYGTASGGGSGNGGTAFEIIR